MMAYDPNDPEQAQIEQAELAEETQLVEEVAPEPEPEQEPDPTDAITSLSDQDMEEMFSTKGMTDLGPEDDLSDLVDVSDADIMGYEEPKSEPPKRYKITKPGRSYIRRYPPPQSMGSIRG